MTKSKRNFHEILAKFSEIFTKNEGENEMEIIGRYLVYTADDEMPDCMICDKCDGDYDCSKFCGPEYGWARYERTEEVARNEQIY